MRFCCIHLVVRVCYFILTKGEKSPLVPFYLNPILPDYRVNVRFRWDIEDRHEPSMADGEHEAEFMYLDIHMRPSNAFFYIQLMPRYRAHEARHTYRRQGEASSLRTVGTGAFLSAFLLDFDHLVDLLGRVIGCVDYLLASCRDICGHHLTHFSQRYTRDFFGDSASTLTPRSSAR